MSENAPSSASKIPDKELIAQSSAWVKPLRNEIARVLVGQADLVDRLLVALSAADAKVRRTRVGQAVRDTKETRIVCAVDLDSAGPVTIHTGVGFFDHMIEQVAAHGGFCFIEFAGDEMPRVSHVRIGLENLLFLQSHMLLVFTNIKRRAQEIEKTKLQAMRNRAPALRQIHECCREALGIFEALGPLDIAAIGGLLDESWQRKKSLSGSVSNESIDRMYELGKRHGAYGGKILGAGGGGFLLLLAPPERHAELKKAFAGFHTLDVEIGVPGSEVIFNAAAARPSLP
jgi:hypothetical protein